MRQSNIILLASQNREKYEEFKTLFSSYPEVEITPANEYIRNLEGLKYVERHDTYLENAMAKARLVNQAAHYASLADDSGLECAALGGKPGVRSHRYATPRPGLSQDEANTQFLIKEIGKSTRDARFVCTLVLLMEGIMLQATGVVEGTIIDCPRGKNGFGYDPVFVPKGSNKTFAEMTANEKNAISHRAKAVHALMNQVRTHAIVFAKP